MTRRVVQMFGHHRGILIAIGASALMVLASCGNDHTHTDFTARTDGPAPSRSSSTSSPAPRMTTSTVTAPASPSTSQASETWSTPDLRLVVGQREGKVAIGPQVKVTNGCYELVASVAASRIDVKGLRHAVGGVCSSAFEVLWAPVDVVPTGPELTVRYRDRTGVYRLDSANGRLHIALVSGDDVTPVVAADWWEVPADTLSIKVLITESGDPTRLERVRDRVDAELLAAGAVHFKPPPGYAILGPATARMGSWPDFATAFRDRDLRIASIRVYGTTISDDDLERISQDAVAGETCVEVRAKRAAVSGGLDRQVSSAPCS